MAYKIEKEQYMIIARTCHNTTQSREQRKGVCVHVDGYFIAAKQTCRSKVEE
jgi:hypothetical protein